MTAHAEKWTMRPCPRVGAQDGVALRTVDEHQHAPKLRGPRFIGMIYTRADAERILRAVNGDEAGAVDPREATIARYRTALEGAYCGCDTVPDGEAHAGEHRSYCNLCEAVAYGGSCEAYGELLTHAPTCLLADDAGRQYAEAFHNMRAVLRESLLVNHGTALHPLSWQHCPRATCIAARAALAAADALLGPPALKAPA